MVLYLSLKFLAWIRSEGLGFGLALSTKIHRLDIPAQRLTGPLVRTTYYYFTLTQLPKHLLLISSFLLLHHQEHLTIKIILSKFEKEIYYKCVG